MQSACTPSVTRGRRAVVACALASSIVLGVSACGSSSSGSSATSSGGSSSSSSGSTSRYQARLAAAECLRAHGLNVPDPNPNGGGRGGGGGGGGGGGIRQQLATPTGQAAAKSCQSQISKAFAFANITPAQRAQFQQDAVKFAECMRAHNVNIPDPTTNGAGGFGILRTIPQSERNSPVFQAALKTCSSTLPNKGRFGRGGAGGNSVGGPGA